jgi:predicted RNase H-like HicB family nuclease
MVKGSKTLSIPVHANRDLPVGTLNALLKEAAFPDLPGCVTFGSTLEEAETMASDALSGVLESMIARGIPLPNPTLKTLAKLEKVFGERLIEV